MFKIVVVKYIQHLGAVGALNHRVISFGNKKDL